MPYTIAIAGKGGTGKTTTAALLVRLIKENSLGSVLAVDADPNSNLGEVLGVPAVNTIGSILDGIAANPESVPSGWTKDRFIEYQVQSAIEEHDGFDIVSMGKPEGPGCYCYVNNILRNLMQKLVKDYDFVIIDNEAGLEHLSRRTTRSADTLLVVSDPTLIGLKAAKRISEIAKELKITTKKELLLINRVDNFKENKISGINLDLVGCLPLDTEISRISLNGNCIWELSNKSLSLAALKNLGEKIWH